jgi:hypothetical protein
MFIAGGKSNNKISLVFFLDNCLLNLKMEQMECVLRKKSGLHPQTITKVRFQPSTTKPDNTGHPTIETEQI